MAKDIRVRFSKRLRELRQKKGYSVSELAKKAGLSRQHIRDIELPIPQKRVTITTLEKLSNGLDISLSRLLNNL